MANSDEKAASGPKPSASGGGGGPPTSTITDVAESAIDLSAYPVMVEQVGPSGPSGAMIAPAGAPAAGFDATVAAALRDVLGWNPRPNDAKGFVGALNQSFDLKDVEGHVEATWKPRSYAVASDLSGGISGAQASLYSRALWAIQQAQPLLAGLYPLSVDADPQDVEALRSSASVQLDKLVEAFGAPGGPVFAIVELRFEALIGHARIDRVDTPDTGETQKRGAVPVEELRLGGPDPDQVGGLLGSLRDILGLSTRADLVNTVDEEQNLTQFRILADYVIGLRQSWVDNRRFFTRKRGGAKPFFGTQLVLLTRQLSVIAESVNELRGALDSVFIGPLERSALEIHPVYYFRENVEEIVVSTKQLDTLDESRDWQKRGGEPIFVEELLSWIQDFASSEGPQIIQEGGKLGVHNLFVPAAKRLYELVSGARRPLNWRALPQGYLTPRVRRSMQELEGQLLELVKLARPIDHKVLASGSFRPVRD